MPLTATRTEMNDQLMISSDRRCTAHLTHGDRWIRIVLSLSDEFGGGELIRVAEGAHFAIEGMDELSSTYTRRNWLSGLTSGALYAFRSLKIPRRHARIDDLNGRLCASDMETVARCSALAVAALANRELLPFDPEGWEIRLELSDRVETNGSNGSHGESAKTTASPSPSPPPAE